MENYDLIKRLKEEHYDLVKRLKEEHCDLVKRLKEEHCDLVKRPSYGFDSLASASQSKEEGKGKERNEEDVPGTRGKIESEIAAIDHQIHCLIKRKSELQGTELLDKLDELHKKIRDLAKTLPENVLSTRKQALGRSGMDQAGERSGIRTRRRIPNGESRRRDLSGRYGRRQRENVGASDLKRAPGHGHYRSQHDHHDANVWGHTPDHGYFY